MNVFDVPKYAPYESRQNSSNNEITIQIRNNQKTTKQLSAIMRLPKEVSQRHNGQYIVECVSLK